VEGPAATPGRFRLSPGSPSLQRLGAVLLQGPSATTARLPESAAANPTNTGVQSGPLTERTKRIAPSSLRLPVEIEIVSVRSR